MRNLIGKTILVTGGTGSFGTKFAKIVLREQDPRVIRVFSRGEVKQQEMCQRFNDKRLRFFIGNVRDKDRLYRAMHNVDIVVHAAALKQVPTCEYNPIEAIKTNVGGAINVIDAAIDNKVSKVIALSTDKAVYPVNLYGATKLVAEKLIIQANCYSSKKATMMSCVRYGNVAGSRGSVIPLFKEQRRRGFLTITDQRMTRFWITQEQAVRFTIRYIESMEGGEIFIPKIPSMKITDLAEIIAPNIRQETIGIRPGEKLNEVLLTKEEAGHTKEFDEYFMVEPEYLFRNQQTTSEQALPEGFTYSSDNNNQWLEKSQLQDILRDLEDDL